MFKYSFVCANSVVLAVLLFFQAVDVQAGVFNGTTTGENGTISYFYGTIDLREPPLVDPAGFFLNFFGYSFCASVVADATYTFLSNPLGTCRNFRDSYTYIYNGCVNIYNSCVNRIKGCVNLGQKENTVQKNIQDDGENDNIGPLIWPDFDKGSLEEEISTIIGQEACMLLVEQVSSVKLVYALQCLSNSRSSQKSSIQIKESLEKECHVILMDAFKEILNIDNICEKTIGKFENKVKKKWCNLLECQIKAMSEIYVLYLMDKDQVNDKSQYKQEKTQVFHLLFLAINTLLSEKDAEDGDESIIEVGCSGAHNDRWNYISESDIEKDIETKTTDDNEGNPPILTEAQK